MKPEQAKALRVPFPPEAIGKLPKGGIQLDYVGHAATTDRLLQVDPEWHWEPFALDERGLPALDSEGNLWIKLTICGVERPGVGDGKSMKERIGDAIRNAAMRFGVALDLWAKEDLGGGDLGGTGTTVKNKAAPAKPRKTPEEAGNGGGSTFVSPDDAAYATAVKGMWATITEMVDKQIATVDDLKNEIYAQYEVQSTKELSLADVKAITAALKLRLV